MENKSIQIHPQSESDTHSGLWPWYVYLITGFGLTGIFPWLLLGRAFYQRGRKREAVFCVAANSVIFIVFALVLLRIRVPWWWLPPGAYFFNFIWSFGAWLFQKKSLGTAETRYVPAEWRSWIVPVLIGIVIGVSITTVFSALIAVGDRVEMRRTLDTLDRVTILWALVKYSYWGIPIGLIIGLWWAGERKRFSAMHIVTFLSALMVTFVLWVLLELLTDFLIHKGSMLEAAYAATHNMMLVLPWQRGVKRIITQANYFTFIPVLIIVSFFFGAAGRIRDFGKRILLVPLSFICMFPLFFTDNDWWSQVQDQVVYETTSPEIHTRASANDWAEIMLRRYPDHQQWPKIAEGLARYRYEQGDYNKAGALYREIVDRYENSDEWRWEVKRARAALKSPDFGKGSRPVRIDIPAVDYENYLTHNWMALLSLIHYWEGADVTDSEIKIRLKELSASDDTIRLNKLTSFADLDDAARSMGYAVLILPAGMVKPDRLITAGIPFIHQCYDTFCLVFGVDKSRSAVCAYSFRDLSKRLKQEARKEAKEILEIEKEGFGKSRERLQRIAREAYFEYSFDFWDSPSLKYVGPLIAIVYPEGKSDDVANATGMPMAELKREHEGCLAALIAFSFLRQADPVQAVEWAKISAEKTDDPLPLYVAHLAGDLWSRRDSLVNSVIPLQNQLPELKKMFDWFDDNGNAAFLEKAAARFGNDINTDVFPWYIYDTCLQMLDRSNPEDMETIVQILKKQISANPVHKYWMSLAGVYEWSDDVPHMVDALKGAVSSDPYDFKAKLQLAYGLVLTEDYKEAKNVLQTIDAEKIKFDADYPFCLAAVAQWEGNVKEALREYEAAADMRRYKPVYYLNYGKLLLKEGMNDKAIKALEWAARIDGGDKIKKEAEALLADLNNGKKAE